MRWINWREKVERSLSTISTFMLFTFMFIAHGITHMMKMGYMKTSLGRNGFLRICKNSFRMRYFRVIPGRLLMLFYSSLFLKLSRAMVSRRTVMPVSTMISVITFSMPTPIIISLRMAEM